MRGEFLRRLCLVVTTFIMRRARLVCRPSYYMMHASSGGGGGVKEEMLLFELNELIDGRTIGEGSSAFIYGGA